MEVAFSILGSVASIVGVLLPAQGWRQRALHFVYGLAIIVLAYFVATYQEKLSRVVSIERIASRMVAERQMGYTHEGYVLAVLAFLEKNRDLYPDTYQRALAMCDQYKCDRPSNNTDIVSLAFAMQGLLKGLATIDNSS